MLQPPNRPRLVLPTHARSTHDCPFLWFARIGRPECSATADQQCLNPPRYDSVARLPQKHLGCPHNRVYGLPLSQPCVTTPYHTLYGLLAHSMGTPGRLPHSDRISSAPPPRPSFLPIPPWPAGIPGCPCPSWTRACPWRAHQHGSEAHQHSHINLPRLQAPGQDMPARLRLPLLCT